MIPDRALCVLERP